MDAAVLVDVVVHGGVSGGDAIRSAEFTYNRVHTERLLAPTPDVSLAPAAFWLARNAYAASSRAAAQTRQPEYALLSLHTREQASGDDRQVCGIVNRMAPAWVGTVKDLVAVAHGITS